MRSVCPTSWPADVLHVASLASPASRAQGSDTEQQDRRRSRHAEVEVVDVDIGNWVYQHGHVEQLVGEKAEEVARAAIE